jgi:beta-1,2-mannobiose phosphorylase / 1,2-beta-oligomannan phosphorylase
MTDMLATRVGGGPLLTRTDVPPINGGFEVQAVLNPAAARVGDEIVLLTRVAERPRSDIDPPSDARTLDLSGLHPKVVPLPSGYRKEDVVAIAVADPGSTSLRHIAVYLPRDLPGLDTSDPRGLTFTHPTLGRTVTLLTQVSHLRCARSHDGIHFTVDEAPALSPSTHLEEYGCEDARATLIDGVWHITYVAVSRVGVTPCLALTRDFRTFERCGALLSPDNKDVVLFPFRKGDRYTALTRPMPSSFGHVLGIWLSFPDRGLPWGGYRPLVLPRDGCWDERQTGAGTVPIRCDAGWLEIYHGVDADHTYALGAVLLKGDDPRVVLARSAEPIMRPEAPYERAGLMSNVVFTCGHVTIDAEGDRIRVYYGAADSVIAAADFSVREIVDSLVPSDSPGLETRFLI